MRRRREAKITQPVVMASFWYGEQSLKVVVQITAAS